MQIMGLQLNNSDERDSYMEAKVKGGLILAIYQMELSIFTTNYLPQADEKHMDMFVKNRNLISQEVLEY